ncbi:O-succinylbenzoic acid--CoA ligase [Cyclobacterium lianum]|uniref:O-succinylbenzoic acid--CoA ligase n=1 Tax=Cyclobacterium lianum TaxID=388280 RepID=A0A1M7QM13_9BACT|nr:AMP-binding protein [Cyclobacterium lianum]SHN32201.1 O-succinylbenzoic acid--CoA ligase [Cyclobacterium lianum]
MIIFGNTSYTKEQIKSGVATDLLSEYARGFEFCRDWLNGAQRFFMQTSGSTGRPKQIEVNRSQLISSVRATGRFFEVTEGWKLLCCLDVEKIAGKMMLIRAMEWEGEALVQLPTANPLKNVVEDAFDFVAMVPLQVEACLSEPGSSAVLNQVRNLIVGGAPLSASLRKKMQQLKGNVYQTYGMTETVSHIALANVKNPGPLIYQALPEVELRIDAGNKLAVKAPMTGNQWVQTQDVVDLISPYSFCWKGRADFIVNSGGVKIHPEEVSEAVSGLVQDCFPGRRYFVSGLPDNKLGQILVLVVEGNPIPEREKTFLEHARALLPRFSNPKRILFVSEFKMTQSGKIDQLQTLASWKN